MGYTQIDFFYDDDILCVMKHHVDANSDMWDNDNLRSGFFEAQNIKPFLIQNNNMWDIIQL
jgi:hypothetical protein